MNREETEEAIKIMQHFADGGEVEERLNGEYYWEFTGLPLWNWTNFNYRIKQEPMSVDWSHVREDIVAIAADKNGGIFGFSCKPKLRMDSTWSDWFPVNGSYVNVEAISSLKRGTVPWDKSLIIRPGYGG